ncbi:hypothetical protein DFH08DRAFT_900119 [Mycena albidolilacea]|uniref:Uncharacterized protein n=1 Tax=Mycena albidolilacea TaxID=1033008 RepID=A0AAD7EAV9_9AGAR|nr:hypothetical protein DFH08DRAFT_900119 [Mycena albidolilacea]
MTTPVLIVSPGKENRRIEISSPTIRALDSFQSKALPPDYSWDHDLYVKMRAGDDGIVVCERDRADERHAKLKARVKTQDERFETLELALADIRKENNKALADIKKEHAKDREELDELRGRLTGSERSSDLSILHLQAIVTYLEDTISTMDLIEEYQVVDGMLQAFNDRIFDIQRDPGLKSEEKQILKANELSYILHLLRYVPERESNDPDISPVEKAFYAAESLLTNEEWEFCYRLQAHRETLRDVRNAAQHLRPDRSTAKRWLTQIVPEYQDTFTNLLDSNPLRMKTSQEDSSDLRIVVDDGEYEGPEKKRALLAQLREVLQEMQREEAARVGEKRKHPSRP